MSSIFFVLCQTHEHLYAFLFRAKLNEVNDEIEELRKKLGEKEMRAAEVKMELHGHDESIENIRGTFARQTTRLAKKEAAIKESRKEWETEETLYKKARTEHEEEVTAHSEALIAHDNLTSQIKKESLIAEQLASVISKEVIVTNSTNDTAPNEEVVKAQAEVLRCEALADEANQILNAAKSVIDNLRDEISTIEVRLPILEAEKKQAASKRDFKAAGKASKTIKELIARKESCETELNGDAVERQTSAQSEVDQCLNSLEEKKTILHEKEKVGGRERMIQLVKKMFKLEKLREDICGLDEEESDGESVKVVGGFVLDSEIAALVSEGEALGNKFGGWNEVIMEYAEASDGSDTKSEEDITESQIVNDTEAEESDEVITEEEVIEAKLAEESETNAKSTEIDEGDKTEVLKQGKSILSQITDIETQIEVAIEEDDYDTAGELDEKIQTLQYELNKLGLSSSEIESLKIDDAVSSSDSKGSQSTEKSYDIVPSKPEGHETEIEAKNGEEVKQEVEDS